MGPSIEKQIHNTFTPLHSLPLALSPIYEQEKSTKDLYFEKSSDKPSSAVSTLLAGSMRAFNGSNAADFTLTDLSSSICITHL